MSDFRVIVGDCIEGMRTLSFDRYPVQRRAQCDWLFEEFRD